MHFRIAEQARSRYGRPLYPIDDSDHVPHVERSAAFVEALDAAVDS